MNRPRFLADNDLNDSILAGVLHRVPSVMFVRVRDVGLGGATDDDVLAYAQRMSLCVVSHDVNTMPAAAVRVTASGLSFPGLFVIRQSTPLATAIDSLVLVWSASRHEEWRDLVVFLPF